MTTVSKALAEWVLSSHHNRTYTPVNDTSRFIRGYETELLLSWYVCCADWSHPTQLPHLDQPGCLHASEHITRTCCGMCSASLPNPHSLAASSLCTQWLYTGDADSSGWYQWACRARTHWPLSPQCHGTAQRPTLGQGGLHQGTHGAPSHLQVMERNNIPVS